MKLFRNHVLVCGGGGCQSSGCKDIQQKLINNIKAKGLEDEIKVVATGCMGPCSLGPMMIIYPEGVLYCKLKPENVDIIVEKHLYEGTYVERFFYRDPYTQEAMATIYEIPFFTRQKKIALRNVGIIDPLKIEEYIAFNGYFALAKALTELTPKDVIEIIKESGLRGRGGAGFPTGLKWEFTAQAQGQPKYVVCNADEGDPGAFMDRSIIEGDPHNLIEGMAIAAYAVGANQGYVYIRAEYPMAVEHLKYAIEQAREYGLLGTDILGSGFDFNLEIRVGAGAFVCGEETALLRSIEGKRGEPRPKPPFPAQQGLWQHPTLLNNVETYANVSTIILKGPQWFKNIGTEKSKGTKVFALAGDVVNSGLVEVPMGTPLGDIIFDIGGGIINKKEFKAAQTGGPSGGCIPASGLNIPVDYDSLQEWGTIMGSGGLIVIDENTCMVDLAKFFLEFCQDESCGKCSPCRLGTKRMLEILQRITEGEGREGDIETLIRLSEDIMDTALCGLGQTAPNPVLNTIRYFRDEYEKHINDKYCNASVCDPLFIAPCQNACPADVDVPQYIEFIQRGMYFEAVKSIRKKNPFPSVCGRVCTHPCESRCRRAQLDEAIAIRSLKRFAADYELQNAEAFYFDMEEGEKSKNGKKIAVIGGGPAGLTAAYYLAIWGYDVTIFETSDKPGGMLNYAIPPYRLPNEVLNKEIDIILKAGINLVTEIKVGQDIMLNEIRENFDAVFMGIGTQQPVRLQIEGEDAKGVIPALEYLYEINQGRTPETGEKVIVVGGGSTAFDAARSTVRLGAKEVCILYRRSKWDMPALPEEKEHAAEEGIKIYDYIAPVEIIVNQEGRMEGVRCIRMAKGEFDNTARRKPVPIEGSEFIMDANTLLIAIGAQGEVEGFDEIETTKWKTFKVNPETLETSLDGVFAGGDCIHGPDTVIQSIADGRKAALNIDKYLGGNQIEIEKAQEQKERRYFSPIIEHEQKRLVIPLLDPQERKKGFWEIELPFDEYTCQQEALRCLRCDVKL
ncbi:MAG TPA: NADH-quinone oxidoreductase subunit NuoF [Clostridiales bacterium]|nr:NADH-quinone oxidoreductase subunit NuoF [Clostridiales bacterium]